MLCALQDQPGDVPELVRELPALLDGAGREAHVLRRGDLQQPVPRRVGPVRVDRLDRVDAGAEALGHAPPVGGEHGRVDDHVGERHLTHHLEARPDHPVLPEADDLAGGRVDVARVVGRELRRVVGPAERRVRPQRRREPRVEDVGVAREGNAGAGLRLSLFLGGGAHGLAVGRVPDRELVPPPQLARQAPVGRLLQRLDREAVLRLGVVPHAALLQRGDGRAGGLVHAAPPLQRDERLDAGVAALARPDRVPVVLALDEPPALLHPSEHRLVGLRLARARQGRRPRRSCGRPDRSPSARAGRGHARSRSPSGRGRA